MVAAEHSAATYRKVIFESQFGKLVFEDALHIVFKEGSVMNLAANYRKNGYDFMAITDHERYYPSLEAKDVYQDVPIGLNIVEC